MNIKRMFQNIAKAVAKQPALMTSLSSPRINRQTSNDVVPWTRFHSRKKTWDDLHDMDSKDITIARALDVLINKALINPDGSDKSKFEIKGDKSALDVINPLVERTGLAQSLWEIMRCATLFGDHFCELVFDENYQIQAIKSFPEAWRIIRNEDQYGRLLAGNPSTAIDQNKSGYAAFEELDEYGTKIVAAFWPYQLVHFRVGRRQSKSVYTEPLLGPAIAMWKRYQAKMDSLGLARLTRAYSQRVHKIPVAARSPIEDQLHTIDNYRNNLTEDTLVSYNTTAAQFQFNRREVPTEVTTDYYVPRFFTPDGKVVDSEIETLEGSPAQLREIDDIYLDIKLLLCAIGVPIHQIGLNVGQRSFIDKSSDKTEEAFLYGILRIQEAATIGMREIFDLQLLINGVDPSEVEYEIIMPRISPQATETSAKTDMMRMQTAAMASKIGLPIEIIGSRFMGLTPEEIEIWTKQGGNTSESGIEPTDT